MNIKESTLLKIKEDVSFGIEYISKEDFINRIKILGYEIDNDRTFNYVNTANSIIYKAKSVYIREIETKKGFANIFGAFYNSENMKKLQEIRFEHAVYNNGRIWEL